MRRALLIGILALAPALAGAAEDLRVEQLKQDIAELRRLIREQARRIDELERQLARPRASLPQRPTAAPAVPPGSDKWLSNANWERVSPGMTEQQVLDVLGYPTSVREGEQPGSKTLFYTVQVGSNGFLSGRVVIANGEVREVHAPTLR